jgi:hypothetical protein
MRAWSIEVLAHHIDDGNRVEEVYKDYEEEAYQYLCMMDDERLGERHSLFFGVFQACTLCVIDSRMTFIPIVSLKQTTVGPGIKIVFPLSE